MVPPAAPLQANKLTVEPRAKPMTRGEELLTMPSIPDLINRALRRTEDATAPAEAEMVSTTSNYTGYKLSGIRMLTAEHSP